VIKARLGDRIDPFVQRAFPFLFKRRLDPNALTVVGTLVSLGAAVAFAAGHFAWGALLLLAGGFFDLVDGVVARHHGISSRFGAFLDSSLDRLVDMAVLLGVAMHYAIAGQARWVLLAGVVLIASVMISYTKARAERFVAEFGGGIFERGERVALLAAGGLFQLMVPALWVLAIGTTWTAVQRFVVASRELARMDAGAQREPTG
jgi:phosphatidylglycerophosphate synthase